MTPDKVSSVSEEQLAHRIAYNDHSRWWAALSDSHRRALLKGTLSMSEEAFLAGVRAGLRSSAPRTSEDAAWLRAMAQHTTRPDWEAERLNRIANTLDCCSRSDGVVE